LLQEAIPLGPDETAGSLHDRLAELGARLLVETLQRLQEGSLTPTPQDDRLATLAPKLRPEEQVLDWNRPAVALERHIRALHPHPGAVTFHGDRRLIVERAAVVAPGEAGGSAEPGQVLEAVRHGRLLIQTGDGVLEILELRPAGKRTMTARDYLNGFPTEPGERMGSNAPGGWMGGLPAGARPARPARWPPTSCSGWSGTGRTPTGPSTRPWSGGAWIPGTGPWPPSWSTAPSGGRAGST